jgi:hypothetical protein
LLQKINGDRVNVIKLSNKLPLLLERTGGEENQNQGKILYFDPLILTFSRREKGLFA